MKFFIRGETQECHKCQYSSSRHGIEYVPSYGPTTETDGKTIEEHFIRTCPECGFTWHEAIHPSRKDIKE